MKKTARFIPEPFARYFPKCARAGEGIRTELIALGSSYAFGGNGCKANGKYALWAFVLAAFEDTPYYNEIGREPLSSAASNYRELQMKLFFDSLPIVKRYFYQKMMGLINAYLEFLYYDT